MRERLKAPPHREFLEARRTISTFSCDIAHPYPAGIEWAPVPESTSIPGNPRLSACPRMKRASLRFRSAQPKSGVTDAGGHPRIAPKGPPVRVRLAPLTNVVPKPRCRPTCYAGVSSSATGLLALPERKRWSVWSGSPIEPEPSKRWGGRSRRCARELRPCA